ncbi:RNA polymerase sigma factor [Actinomadura syzygii]|uniref:RNA polymerase sigma factor n=1 Tax=Actinomadura syzygii TaxID=1427538 RepID=A0A5D0UK45_9ACTN|nr:RNA polymerase sigma factor [Actinomadura syzygii]TYC18891.1 RNA polymerase sigma factor [Actinomadura syzygii]
MERADEEQLGRALRAAQDGDEESFRMLYRDVQPRLIRFAGTLVGADAEDVTSEAWLQIARDLPSFRGDLDGFRGWTATITRHRALDHLRRRSRRPGSDLPVEELLTMAADADTEVDALDGIATKGALGLIAELPRDQAEAVMLRVVVGLDAKSAGEVLGKRPGAVRTASYRGLRRLAERLSASGREEQAGGTGDGGTDNGGDGRVAGAPDESGEAAPGGVPLAQSDKTGGPGAEGVS